MAIGSRRNHRRIQEVLDQRLMNFKSVKEALGTSYHTVWSTAHGRQNNRKVLRYFLELGVSPDVLDLPKDMLKELERKKEVI